MTIRFAAIAAVGLLLAAFVQSTAGNGIGSIDVGLDGIPPTRLITARTDARGRVDIAAPQGMHGLLLPAVQAAREAARRSAMGSPPPGGVVARVEAGRSVLTSAPLMLDGRGRADFMGPDGRRLVVAIPRGGARVRVTLTGCCWATDARGPAGAVPGAAGAPR